MNAFNRGFVVVVSLVWIAAWAGVAYLMWTPGRELSEANRYFQYLFDVSVAGSDRILANLIAAVAIALGLGLMAAQAMPPSRRPKTADIFVHTDEARYGELNRRIEDLQRRLDSRDFDRRAMSQPMAVAAGPDGFPNQPRRRWNPLQRDRR